MRAARTLSAAIFASIASFAVARASPLTADNLLLIVNRNVPDGVGLAQYYAAQRHVPDGRIVALDLPTGDNLPFDDYALRVVAPVRQFLHGGHLERQVTCLVTFEGVPLRIAARTPLPTDAQEQQDMQRQAGELRTQIEREVADAEAIAQPMPPPPALPVPADSGVVPSLRIAAQRADTAINRAVAGLADLPPDQRDATLDKLLPIIDSLGGDGAAIQTLVNPRLRHSTQPPASADEIAAKRAALADADRQLAADLERASDPAARADARRLAIEHFGLFHAAGLTSVQLAQFGPGETTSALDNELPLLWSADYPRPGALANPLNLHASQQPNGHVLMASRIDAPTPAIARDLIDQTLRTEQRGLQGLVVVDAGGGLKIDPGRKNPAYHEFDKFLATFGLLVRDHSPLPLAMDQSPDVILPHTEKNVALYTGWYSVGHYIPSCDFVTGAVAYHIASCELYSLHEATNTGWCRGLMLDGAVATVGPVAEPYLSAFPRPDEFYPLLMTGRITLAEAYWKTEPQVSWMMGLVGDPLYNPFKAKPAMPVEALSTELQAAIER